ncbi:MULTISPECIES: gamma-glutamylcyclotransferase family protein [Rhodomicrobium]|uniref:gamma-glutamylcyclotransferase family protein n=1 Tax=Rhodomicrobium TaxID=1068 RepID=UPI001482A819|nr:MULTISPECIES: gamma-glutamylcyclotransferase family protein [Rhodomicrobium]
MDKFLRTDALFIYGTLRPGSGHGMARRLAAESAYLGPAAMPGRLYRIGAYPGAVPTEKPGEIVHGDAVRLLNPGRTFAWLDEYEGCGVKQPEPQAYQRVIVPVRLHSREALQAWVYFYHHPVHPARRIPDGRFLRNGRLPIVAPFA